MFKAEAPHWLDARGFLAKARLSEAMERRGDLPVALAACRKAAGLYHGRLLEDEPYSDWCSRKREYLRSMYLGCLRRVGRLCRQQGDYTQAIDAYRRALAVDPLLERTSTQPSWRSSDTSDSAPKLSGSFTAL